MTSPSLTAPITSTTVVNPVSTFSLVKSTEDITAAVSPGAGVTVTPTNDELQTTSSELSRSEQSSLQSKYEKGKK